MVNLLQRPAARDNFGGVSGCGLVQMPLSAAERVLGPYDRGAGSGLATPLAARAWGLMIDRPGLGVVAAVRLAARELNDAH